jgi:hypothetical protein
MPYTFTEALRSSAPSAQGQARLIRTLLADIRVAGSLLDAARVSRNHARKSEIRNMVRRAILSIQFLSDEIEDQHTRMEVQGNAERLQDLFELTGRDSETIRKSAP